MVLSVMGRSGALCQKVTVVSDSLVPLGLLKINTPGFQEEHLRWAVLSGMSHEQESSPIQEGPLLC